MVTKYESSPIHNISYLKSKLITVMIINDREPNHHTCRSVNLQFHGIMKA